MMEVGEGEASEITMITDASFCPDTGVGGYGVWVKGEGRSTRLWGGPFKTWFTSSTHAELMSIAVGLRLVTTQGYIRPTDRRMILQNDCTEALVTLVSNLPDTMCRAHAYDQEIVSAREFHGATPLDRSYQEIVEQIRLMLVGQKFIVLLRHVMGHQASEGGRFAVNAICDRMARKGMQSARRRVQGGKR